MNKILLRAEGVYTRPKHGTGLEHVSFRVGVGELVGFFTLNQQGLTELLALLSQGQPPHTGKLLLHELPVLALPSEQVALITSPYLHVDSMSVAENLLVLNQRLPMFWINNRKLKAQARAILDDFGLGLDTATEAKDLTPIELFLLSLLKSYLAKVSIVVLKDLEDLFSDEHVRRVLALVRRLQAHGMSFIYISSSLDLMLEETSTLMVFRDGRISQTFYLGQNRQALYRQLAPQLVHTQTTLSQVRLMNLAHNPLFQRVAIPEYLHEGESLTLIHPDGAVLRELVSCFFDWTAFDEILLYSRLAQKQICFVPSGARESSLFKHCSYLFNLCFFLDVKLGKQVIPTRYLKHIEKTYEAQIGEVVHARHLFNLSDEQLSELLYQRILLLAPQVVVLHDPFADCPLDLRHYIQGLINKLKQRGIGVLIFSTDAVSSQLVSDQLILCD